MATALKNPEWTQPTDRSAAPSNDDNAQVPVSAVSPGVVPERVIVREISFLMDSDGLQFLYKDAGPAMPLPGGNIDMVIEHLALGKPLPFGDLGDVPMGSDGTPLDLGVTGEAAYVVFKLDPRLNWRFSDNDPVISHKQAGDAAYYGGLRHVRPNGTYSDRPVADCRIVFLVAMPPDGEYKHGFNFHVDMIQKPHLDHVRERILPLIIDPDIRFPGGSGT
ncbi:MAG TPA: nucleotide synthetase [Allosphingosinicella sp.]|nr:nucleotide synthetase [Allosphingosinicella sp.]